MPWPPTPVLGRNSSPVIVLTGSPVAVIFHRKPVAGVSGKEISNDSPLGSFADLPVCESVKRVMSLEDSGPHAFFDACDGARITLLNFNRV